MSDTKKNKNSSSQLKNNKPLKIKGEIDVEYFAISKEVFDQLEEYSNSSTSFDFALFFFTLSVTLFTTIITAEIKNLFLFSTLLIIATISFVIGFFKYIGYKKNKRNISTLLKKIKKNKCTLV